MVSRRSRKDLRLLSTLSLCLFFAQAAPAQPATQVVDLNTTQEQEALDSYVDQPFAALDGELYYTAADGLHGVELWKTDGTPGGEVLLADICPGICGSMPRALTRSGNRILFFAEDGVHGRELWATDGTPGGTTLVKDIRPGTRSGNGWAWMLDAAGTVYFPADDGTHGDELWKSDGTAAGTVLVRDIRPGAESSVPVAHAVAGGTILLDADDGTHGREPWRTDGTAEGTQLLKDIRPGSLSSTFGLLQGTEDQWLATSGGLFLFTADDGTHGPELWASDGTEAGTVQITDLDTPFVNLPGELTELVGTVYFTTGSSAQGAELWRTNGTAAGTSLVKDIVPGSGSSNPAELTVAGNLLYFRAREDVHGHELWTSDGTETGTVLVEDIRAGTAESLPRGLREFNGQLAFFATQDPGSTGLWKSDGTAAGTNLVSNFGGQAYLLITADSLPAGTLLFFRAYDPQQEIDLWASDGTTAGTQVVAEATSLTSSIAVSPWNGMVAEPSAWGALGQKLIYLADDGTTGHEPWVSDGTPAGTLLLAETVPGTDWSYYFGLTSLGNGKALFSDFRLWLTDGTPPGTGLLDPGGEPQASGLTRFGSAIFFISSASGGRSPLWKTDGTVPGTVPVRDFYRLNGMPGLRALTPVGGTLFFSANGNAGSQNLELWKSDGTTAGTTLVEEIRPGLAGSSPDLLTPAGNRLFFTADDGTTGREPWVSDGTEAGTFRLKDIVPGAGSSVATLAELEADHPGESLTAGLGSTFFFLAKDASGEELWASDGTEAGTRLVKDVHPGAAGSEPRWLTVAGGHLYFTADDGKHGRELWRTDGTEAGTVLVTDLLPGAGSSLPRGLLAIKSVVVFSATDGTHGVEPWASDGTWVRSLGDLAPDALPSSPTRFTAVADQVYFGANDGTSGFELWAFPQSALATPLDFYTVTPCRVADTRGTAPLRTDQPRSFQVTGSCGIPADAKAVAANLTAVASNGPGFLIAWPTGTGTPETSSLNYQQGITRSNNGVVELGTGGQLEVQGQTGAENGQVHLVVDVVGYFR